MAPENNASSPVTAGELAENVQAGSRDSLDCSTRVDSAKPCHVPHELRALRQWITWHVERITRADGSVKFDKLPDDPSWPNTNAWRSYDDAQAAGRPAFVFGRGGLQRPDGATIIALDLDSCRDPASGRLHEWAVDLILRTGKSFTEVTPSGSGLRLWVAVRRAPAKWSGHVFVPRQAEPATAPPKAVQVEVFGNGSLGFVTVTGQKLAGTSDEILTVDDLEWWPEVFGRAAEAVERTPSTSAPAFADEQTQHAYDLARADYVLREVFPDPDVFPYPLWLRKYMAAASLGPDGKELARQWNRRGTKGRYEGHATDAKAASFNGELKVASLFDDADEEDSAWRHRFDAEQPQWREERTKRAFRAAQSLTPDTNAPAAAAAPAEAPAAAVSATIVVEAGATDRMLRQVEAALMASPLGTTLFQRGGQLVRVVRRDEPARVKGCAFPKGSLHLVAVTATWWERAVESVVMFLKPSADGPPRRVGCPAKLAEKYLADVGAWRVPPLVGIVTAPTLRADGSILQTPGYDAASGILFDPLGVEFPPVPESPTRDDALAALRRVLATVETFPFKVECDRSVWVAGLMTAIARHVVGAAPLFGFTATTAGSGKTTLCDGISLVALGQPGAAFSLARGDDNEMRKALLAMLSAGAPIVPLDNIVDPVDSAALAAVLTSGVLRGRVLGQTQVVDVPTTATFLANGNALMFRGDLARRVLLAELDPECEHPDSRRFAEDPRAVWSAQRPQLVVDVLTVLRAYQLAGRPSVDELAAYGSFEQWSAWIRGPLVWLGLADPIESRERLRAEDPVAGGLRRVLAAWQGAFGARELTASEVLKELAAGDPFTAAGDTGDAPPPRAALALALRELLSTDRPIDAVQLGNALRVHRGRIVAGLRISSRTAGGGLLKWSVAPVPDSDRPGVGLLGRVGHSTTSRTFLPSPEEGVASAAAENGWEGCGAAQLRPTAPLPPAAAPSEGANPVQVAPIAEVLQ